MPPLKLQLPSMFLIRGAAAPALAQRRRALLACAVGLGQGAGQSLGGWVDCRGRVGTCTLHWITAGKNE